MPSPNVSPGGVLLPSGTTVASVIPALGDGRTPVTRYGQGSVPRAADTGRGPAEGVPRSYQEVYDSQQYVGAVVNKLARHVARVPLVVEKFVPADAAKPNSRARWRRVDDDHALVRLLARPTPGMGQFALKLAIAHGLLVEGNSLTYRHRDVPDGPPTQLFPLTWDRHVPYRPKGGLIDRWYSSEVDGTRVFDSAREILHVAYWSRSGAEGQLGLSPLEQLVDPLRIDDAAERHAYAFLAGGAHPSGAFQLPSDVELTPEIAAALRTVLDAWTGVDAAGGVPILASGADWKTYQPNAKDAALIETRQHSLGEVCMVYDVSPTTIGDLRHATQRGNVGELIRDLYSNTLAAPIALMVEAFNTQLVANEPEWNEEGEHLRIRGDVSEFTRGDPDKWDKMVNERIRHGRLTINRARELDGEEPWDDERADEPMILDSNIHPLSQVGEEIVQTVQDSL